MHLGGEDFHRPVGRGEIQAALDDRAYPLRFAVTNLHQLDTILPAVKALGERHKGYGVTADHYAPVGAALLWTLEKGLGADFTPETKEAWTAAYTALAGVMSS